MIGARSSSIASPKTDSQPGGPHDAVTGREEASNSLSANPTSNPAQPENTVPVPLGTSSRWTPAGLFWDADDSATRPNADDPANTSYQIAAD
jgi:hypothetical protein